MTAEAANSQALEDLDARMRDNKQTQRDISRMLGELPTFMCATAKRLASVQHRRLTSVQSLWRRMLQCLLLPRPHCHTMHH
jgi:predicted DNA-binding ArsR family transcriptional regulator